MYEALSGYVVGRNGDSVDIAPGPRADAKPGLVYEVIVISPCGRFEIDEFVTLLLYHQKGEYADNLYGFQSREERLFFYDLISCDKVGPRAAINVMALGTVENIKQAIRLENVDFLQRARGVSKSANNIILKLGRKYGEAHAKLQPGLL